MPSLSLPVVSATSVSLLCGYYSTSTTTNSYFGTNTYSGTCASPTGGTNYLQASTGTYNYGSLEYPVQLCVGADGVDIYAADQGKNAASARDIRAIEINYAPPPPSPPPR